MVDRSKKESKMKGVRGVKMQKCRKFFQVFFLYFLGAFVNLHRRYALHGRTRYYRNMYCQSSLLTQACFNLHRRYTLHGITCYYRTMYCRQKKTKKTGIKIATRAQSLYLLHIVSHVYRRKSAVFAHDTITVLTSKPKPRKTKCLIRHLFPPSI